MSTEAIRASARRILELARTLPKYRQHDFIAEAACILKLTEPSRRERQIEHGRKRPEQNNPDGYPSDEIRGTRYDPENRRRV